MTLKQAGVGSFNAALLGASNRVARHKRSGECAKRLLGSAHHVTFGTTDIGNHCLTQLNRGQLSKHLLHRQNRHGEHDHIGACTAGG